MSGSFFGLALPRFRIMIASVRRSKETPLRPTFKLSGRSPAGNPSLGAYILNQNGRFRIDIHEDRYGRAVFQVRRRRCAAFAEKTRLFRRGKPRGCKKQGHFRPDIVRSGSIRSCFRERRRSANAANYAGRMWFAARDER
ncbi:MAG TPA: hypothetical protein VN699_06790 [Pirellulales bacterium]|nr:hypothetical protein [Pirellulales bacterium]